MQKLDVATASQTPGLIRVALRELLIGDSDFDAFVIDHFPAVFARFSNGMDRVQKETLLIQHVDPAAIISTLDRVYSYQDNTYQNKKIAGVSAKTAVAVGTTIVVVLWIILSLARKSVARNNADSTRQTTAQTTTISQTEQASDLAVTSSSTDHADLSTPSIDGRASQRTGIAKTHRKMQSVHSSLKCIIATSGLSNYIHENLVKCLSGLEFESERVQRYEMDPPVMTLIKLGEYHIDGPTLVYQPKFRACLSGIHPDDTSPTQITIKCHTHRGEEK